MTSPNRFIFAAPTAGLPTPLLGGGRVWTTWNGARPAPWREAAGEVIEAGLPGYDLNRSLNAPTAVGLTEQQLLLAINSGDVAGLQAFRGIGPRVAAHIVDYRRRHRFFASLDELVRVQLIGRVRFRQLAGRESTVLSHPVHALLRVPLDQPVRREDLRGRAWPAPGLPRLHLAADAGEEALERVLAAREGWTLVVRRVGAARLCFHGAQPRFDGWAALLVANLPPCLRRLCASETPVPTPAP
jgi:hypothetical protein